MAPPPFARPALLLACACAASAVVGCGPSTGDVSGTITIRGKAPDLKGLEIGLMGGTGRLVTAPINPDGTYRAAGVPAGEVKVSFLYTPPARAREPGEGRLPRPGAPPARRPGGPEEARNPIPPSLRDGSTSKLSFTVVPGRTNVFNYDVRPQG